MASHLSIFVENKPGKLEKLTRILAENQINLKAFSLASVGEYGIVKIIVNDIDQAFEVLKKEQITVSKRRILIATVPDQPGGLHRLLTVLSANQINIQDCYGFVIENRKEAAIVIEVEKYPLAEEILRREEIGIMADEDLGKI
ncbi:MAG TPA: ACT domain-containing protein [Bacillota bacterium]